MTGTNTEKWCVCAETWVASTTVVTRRSKAALSALARSTTTSFIALPAGSAPTSRVTVAGTAKAVPSGPKA